MSLVGRGVLGVLSVLVSLLLRTEVLDLLLLVTGVLDVLGSS